MKQANKDLKKAYKKIDINDVEDLHDDMSDLLAEADEINEVLGQSYGVPEDIDESDLLEIAKRSKGTPRILKARVKWYQNYLLSVGKDDVDIIFETQGIDKYGMDTYDRKYLEVLEKNLGNPLGVKSISSLTGIAIETIENAIEPYLLREGYVVRTQKGRILGKIRRN